VSRIVDLARVRRALAALDALVARFPGLRMRSAKKRLAKALDADPNEKDQETNGDREEGR
jgi:hypothetical protein